ncbi:MAG: hypothetical protein GVY02_02365 [Bacteroidetes bacterium]|nr:hypothetical protein [Bacteroidota bacterium]
MQSFNDLKAIKLKTVLNQTQSEFKTRGSRFIGCLVPACDEKEVNGRISHIREEHPTATHHCHAWIINPENPREHVNDDGEPSGTAGFPILNSLKSHNLINICLVVVRYYGGTKLGTSGLINAYGKSAKLAIKSASLHELMLMRVFEIDYAYAEQSRINQLKHHWNWAELNAVYQDTVSLQIGVPTESAAPFRKILSGLSHYFERVDELGTTIKIRK